MKTQTRILRASARAFGTTPNELLSRCRRRNVADARFASAYFLRLFTPMTRREIADLLKREKSSARYADKQSRELMETDAQFARKLGQIEKMILNQK